MPSRTRQRWPVAISVVLESPQQVWRNLLRCCRSPEERATRQRPSSSPAQTTSPSHCPFPVLLSIDKQGRHGPFQHLLITLKQPWKVRVASAVAVALPRRRRHTSATQHCSRKQHHHNAAFSSNSLPIIHHCRHGPMQCLRRWSNPGRCDVAFGVAVATLKSRPSAQQHWQQHVPWPWILTTDRNR